MKSVQSLNQEDIDKMLLEEHDNPGFISDEDDDLTMDEIYQINDQAKEDWDNHYN